MPKGEENEDLSKGKRFLIFLAIIIAIFGFVAIMLLLTAGGHF